MREDTQVRHDSRRETAPSLCVARDDSRAELPEALPEPTGIEDSDPLGAPLTIGELCTLLRCSPWTVRQRYLRQGLPHFRSGPSGKLIFFRNQVIRWVLEKQRQKGGD